MFHDLNRFYKVVILIFYTSLNQLIESSIHKNQVSMLFRNRYIHFIIYFAVNILKFNMADTQADSNVIP